MLFRSKMNHKIRLKTGLIAYFLVLILCHSARSQEPILSWDFSDISNRTTVEQQSGIADTLEGYFNSAPGISGKGLRLDGFTACLKHTDRKLPAPGEEITVEAWVSL